MVVSSSAMRGRNEEIHVQGRRSVISEDWMKHKNPTLNWEYVGSIHSTQVLCHMYTHAGV